MRKILAAIAVCGTLGAVMATATPAPAEAGVVVRFGDGDRGRGYGYGRSYHPRRNVVIVNRHRDRHYRYYR